MSHKYYYLKRFRPVLGLFLMLSSINLSHAVLSVQTVKVIEGSKPYLVLADGTKLKNLNHLLGFSMPKQDGSRGTELIDATKDVVTAPKGMKLSDVKALVVADNQAHTVPIGNLKDDDGDVGSPSGTMTAVWKNNGQVMSDLNRTLSSCGGTYTLTISANHLQAQTSYGIPHQGYNYGSTSKTYTFIANDSGICYIQPKNIYFYTDNTVYPQSYNPEVWDEGKGFSVSKMNAIGKYFPTTGFDKAVLNVIGTGNYQNKYRCSTTGDWVRLSGSASKDLGQNCRVTYHHDSKQSKPQTPVTIDMDYTADNGKTWTKIDSYTIPVPQKWAISPVGHSYQAGYGNGLLLQVSTQFPALDACRKVGPRADNKTTSIAEGRGQTAENRAFRQRFMYRRDELTNGKHADRTKYPEGAGNASGVSYYSRDIGTFMGEWGNVQNYGQSPWSANNWSWTAEASEVNYQFYVYTYGAVAWDRTTSSGGMAVCRGE